MPFGYHGSTIDITVLSNVDLTIPVGEFLTILSPSGCGRSTLLRVVADLLDPISGSVKVLGDTPQATRTRRQTGFVFQESTLLPWRTVADTVRPPAIVGGRNASPATAACIADLLGMMGLEGLGHRFSHELSGGQRQRVTSLDALAGSAALRKLSVTNSSVADISSLAGLQNLEILNLMGSKVTELSALIGLPHLRDLSVIGLTLSDPSQIVALKKQGVSIQQ